MRSAYGPLQNGTDDRRITRRDLVRQSRALRCGRACASRRLQSIGLAQYTEAFEASEIDMDILPHLSYLDLKVPSLQSRTQRDVGMHCRNWESNGKGIDNTFLKRPPLCLRDLSQRRRVTNVGSVGTSSVTTNFMKKFLPNSLKLSDMMNGNGRQQIKKSCLHRNPAPRGRGVLSPWQSIPGTDFVVDRFKGIGYLRNEHWFLTHFHADHYGGLTASFNKGMIYCSSVTSKLCQAKLKIGQERLHSLPLNKTVVVAGRHVTLVDANHCPGSVMVIVEGGVGPSVLHTGDARLTPEMYDNEAVGKLKAKGCILVLDTTYCDPKYCFPSQKDVIQYVCDTVLAESFHLKTLFLFGTYGIGKERLFLEVARRAERPVYVSRDKMAALDCMELSDDEKSLLTTDHEATNLHAIALWKVTTESARQILSNYGNRYTHVVGFRPTGWSYEKGMEKTKCGRRHTAGKITIHQVPYSEHSSFNELRDFVRWLAPARIIPSVGNDEGAKREKMLSWLKQKPLM